MARKTYIELNKVFPENDNERLNLAMLIGKRITAISRDSRRNYVFYGERNKPLFMILANALLDQCGNHFYEDCE